MSSGIACGRGGASTRLTFASCDHEGPVGGCLERILITSREDYVAAAAEGWRRHGDSVRCPRHAHDLDDGT